MGLQKEENILLKEILRYITIPLGVVSGWPTTSFSLCWIIMVKSFGIRATLVAAHEFGYELWKEMKEKLMLNKKIENIE